MLEDIALMRALPNMVVVVPCDSKEARRATVALAKLNKPAYLRVAREKTAIITTDNSAFKIGKANVFKEGSDITIVACGPLVYEALRAAVDLDRLSISAEVINCHTIKPIDSETILASAAKTKRVITLEEAQVVGGLGGAVTELLSSKLPTHVERLGTQDRFGQSGTITELWKEYELDSTAIVKTAKAMMRGVKK
jgi:transketolase